MSLYPRIIIWVSFDRRLFCLVTKIPRHLDHCFAGWMNRKLLRIPTRKWEFLRIRSPMTLQKLMIKSPRQWDHCFSQVLNWMITFLSSFFYNFSFFSCLEIEKGEKNTVEIGGKRYKISSCRKVLSLDSRDYEGYLLQ